jgi:hypothetical protein
MSTIKDIADAVVAELNSPVDKVGGTTWSLAFTASRHQIPRVKLEQFKDSSPSLLKVFVVPKTVSIEPASHSDNAWEVEVWIGVHQRVADEIGSDVDALLDLLVEFADYFFSRAELGDGIASLSKVEFDTIYYPRHLDQKRVFTALMSLTFQAVR